MSDPATIAWALAALVFGYSIGRMDRGRLKLPFLTGRRFDFNAPPVAREKPHLFRDDDKQLLAIKDAAQMEAERRAHLLHDRLTLDYWQAGVHVEFTPRLETVARFVAMPALSRRRWWDGGNDTYAHLCAAFVHRGKVLVLTYQPRKLAWSRSWRTCRRRVQWFADLGYPLPSPAMWTPDGSADE
jgi:hypothetical protein